MKYILLTFIFLTFLAIVACKSDNDKLSPEILNAFSDNGHTADSLRATYQCEKVTIDKWEGTDVTDSTFSICLINSQKVPNAEIVIKNDVLKGIASAIKRSLKTPNKYNSFQIVFVKSEKISWFAGQAQAHSMGGVVSGRDL